MKKLLLSIIAVVVTVAALGTSTFAWFTLSNKAEVGQFDAQVTAGEGIEISLDGLNWYTTLTSGIINAHLKAQPANNGSTPKLTDVTSENGTTFSKLVVTDAVGDNGTITTTPVTTGYIEFNIQFRAQNANRIYWTDATLGSPEGQKWVSDAAGFNYRGQPVAQGTTVDLSAANAARISVVKSGETVAQVFELPAGANNTSLTGADTNLYLGNATTTTADGAIGYYNIKNQTNQIDVATTFVMPSNLFSEFAASVGTLPKGVEVLTLAPAVAPVNNITYNVGSVTVRVWLEGWDPDTFNAILTLPLFAGLKFEGATV